MLHDSTHIVTANQIVTAQLGLEITCMPIADTFNCYLFLRIKLIIFIKVKDSSPAGVQNFKLKRRLRRLGFGGWS